ncbi:hypothetical protein BJY04DRAFT_179193 [Aspergillus karnatakaensis]|uniref:uncharacterized protein n=1 Tax=Aspergillus karnatakaensis TaxID=1810916 RepID=UPI003CCD95C7
MRLHDEGGLVDDAPPLAGRASIEFWGRIDDARSDILNNRTPVTWTPTVGWQNNSANLDYGGNDGASLYSEMGLGWLRSGLVFAAWYLVL